MTNASLVLTLLLILLVIVLISAILYIIEFRRVQKLISAQLVMSDSFKNI